MSKVLLENVGKTFDGKKMVLNDFSLQIDDGDFVVLIGPSGCGKTTILNIIAGLECPTTGNVYIDDALSNSVEPKDRDVAMVFQNHALYRLISVCLVSLTTPLIVFLFKQSTDMFPKQLLQTARLDGLSEPKIFLKVYSCFNDCKQKYFILTLRCFYAIIMADYNLICDERGAFLGKSVSLSLVVEL